MTTTTKTLIATAVILTGIVGGIAIQQTQDPLTNLPDGTVFVQNYTHYVPEKVPGYESVADYPDEFWIPVSEFPVAQTKYHFTKK